MFTIHLKLLSTIKLSYFWNWKINYKSTIYIYRVTPVHYLQKADK